MNSSDKYHWPPGGSVGYDGQEEEEGNGVDRVPGKCSYGMDAQTVVARLLDHNPPILAEASVHLPRRGTKWVALFMGSEPGRQVWRSTGLTDRAAALALARKWEAQARKQRLVQGGRPKPASVRVRRSRSGTSGSTLLTQKEVAALLGMSERGVRNVEKRALAKLRRHPALRSLWGQIKGETSECAIAWAAGEVATLFSLANGPHERHALKRLFGLVVRND